MDGNWEKEEKEGGGGRKKTDKGRKKEAKWGRGDNLGGRKRTEEAW